MRSEELRSAPGHDDDGRSRRQGGKKRLATGANDPETTILLGKEGKTPRVLPSFTLSYLVLPSLSFFLLLLLVISVSRSHVWTRCACHLPLRRFRHT